MPTRKVETAGPRAYVALLRGVNVGGKNLLSMKDLAAMFSKAGCSAVQTYIQSGNVVFRAEPELSARLPDAIAKTIAARHQLRIPVVLRSAADLRRVAEGNPFLRRGVEAEQLHVAFLARQPDAAAVAVLDPNRSPPDEFVVLGREVYLHCPNGLGRSKLSNAYFDAKLGTVSTVRNWRTVRTLLDLCGG